MIDSSNIISSSTGFSSVLPDKIGEKNSERLGWKEYGIAIGLGLLTMISSLGLTACSAWLIIRAWQRPTPLELTIVVVSVRFFGISRAVFRYGERIATHKILFLRRAQEIFTMYSQRLTAGFYSHPLSGNALIAYAYQIADEPALVFVPVMIAIIVSSATIIFFAMISPWAALVMGIAYICTLVVFPWVGFLAQKKYLTTASQGFQEVIATVDQILAHREELYCTRALDYYIDRTKNLLLARDRALGKSYRIQAILNALQVYIIGLATLGCCVIAYHYQHIFASPTLGVLMMLPLMSFEAVTLVTPAFHHLLLARNARMRTRACPDYSYLQWSKHLAERLIQDYPQLAFWQSWEPEKENSHALAYSNSQPKPVRNIFTGANGSGKTSTLLQLSGLLSLNWHQLYLQDSDDITNMPMVFLGDSHIFATSIYQNLLLVKPDATRQECWQALQAVNLRAKIEDLPEGIDTKATQLSRGQKKLLTLAQGILCGGKMIFYDEPLENISPERVDAIIGVLMDVNNRASRLIATHDTQLIDTARQAQCLVVELSSLAIQHNEIIEQNRGE